MYINKYMVITPPARKWSGKATVKLLDKLKGNTIASNAVVLKLILDLPDSLFQKPQLEALIKVSPDQVSKPVIVPEVVDNIREVINQQLGIDLQLTVVEKETHE